MWWVWVLLYYWLYYCRLLYYVFLVLTLIVLWTFICICILHYYSPWNHVKNSFWTCYYMSLWSVRYCLVNTKTEPNSPILNFLGTQFFLGTGQYQFPEEPNLHRYRRTERPGWVEGMGIYCANTHPRCGFSDNTATVVVKAHPILLLHGELLHNMPCSSYQRRSIIPSTMTT
jgi:hypothetical protein